MPAQHIIASIYGTCAGVSTITTLHFEEDADTQAARNALAVAIRDRFMPEFKTGCAASMNWIAIVISRRADPNDSPYNLPVNIVGGGSTLGPQQIAIQWNLNTGMAGRRGKGKLYVPGIATAAMAGGMIASATRLSLDAVMGTINGRWAAGGSEQWHLSVWSRMDNVQRPVASVTYTNIFAALHSRRLGVGI